MIENQNYPECARTMKSESLCYIIMPLIRHEFAEKSLEYCLIA